MGEQINEIQVKSSCKDLKNKKLSKSKENYGAKVCHEIIKSKKMEQKSNELSFKDIKKRSFKGSKKPTGVTNLETRKISNKSSTKNQLLLSDSLKSSNKKIDSDTIHTSPKCNTSLLTLQVKDNSDNSDWEDTDKFEILKKKQTRYKSNNNHQIVKKNKLARPNNLDLSKKLSKSKTKDGTMELCSKLKNSVSPKQKANELSFADIEKKIFETSEKQPDVTHSESKKISKKLAQSSTSQNLILDNCSKNSKKKIKNDTAHVLNKCNTSHYPSHKKGKKIDSSKVKSDSDSDNNDWEDVDELSEILETRESNITKDVQIELKASNVLWGIKRRKKRTQQQLIEDYLRKQLNKSIKEVYINMHKTHLLCLLAHGMYLNNCLTSDSLLSKALSIVPKSYFTPKRLDLNHLKKFLSWFCKLISMKKDKSEVSQLSANDEILCQRFEAKFAVNDKELVLMFVAIGRAIGMTVRLVQNLTPLSWKPPMNSLIKPPQNENDAEIKTQSTVVSPSMSKDCSQSKIIKKNRKMLSSDSEVDSSDLKHKSKSSKLQAKITSDDDFDDSLNLKYPSCYRKKNKEKTKSNGKRQGSEIAYKTGAKRQKVSLTEWAEVYMEEEETWISVDVVRCKIHCASDIEARLTNPSYIIGFNPDQTVKDITIRYVSNWLSCKDKIQCDGKWWLESLKPFLEKRDQRSRAEDKALEENLKMQPLPKTLADYKNHPMYALHRHLLKFEAIYPPDEAPVGYFRGEPVFPRSSVKILSGREHWIKEAKTVQVNEEPYKVVKARPKWDKSTCQMIKDRPLELFGEWQVEDYEPPIAKNGKVPRNEYGNVELFKPCMLPRGCIHIPISGIGRVARRLEIDCVPAIVGFDYHSGGSHPIYEGFVICEEAKDILMDAWNQDQFERAKKEEEKRIKRVYDNWKRLIMGITLKERLKEKYGVAERGAEKVTEKKHSASLCDNRKRKKGKIKQEDLDALSSNLITHSVPNLKIDFSTGFSGASSSQTGKRKSAKPRVMSTSFGECNPASSGSPKDSSSGSEDEFSKEEKRKKIRSILQWNPQNTDSQNFGSTLSDESDSDTTDISKKPIQPVPSCPQRKRRPKRSIKVNPHTKERVSKEIEHVLVQTSVGMNRRSLRSLKQIQYTNIDDRSESDITVDDSDISDKAYTPDLAPFPHGRFSSDSE